MELFITSCSTGGGNCLVIPLLWYMLKMSLTQAQVLKTDCLARDTGLAEGSRSLGQDLLRLYQV